MNSNSEAIIKVKEICKRIKTDKKILSAMIIGVVGMLLIFCSDIPDNTESQNVSETSCVNVADIEQRLENFIENINGAGQTQVMITFDCSEEKVFAKNGKEILKENVSEYTKEYIIIDSGGEESGLIEYTVYPKVRGIAIACVGADDPIVKERIISSVSALFSLSTNKISVTAMIQ